MSYKEWFENHAKKHKKIVDKLLACGMDEDEIIDYFCYENMAKNEVDFCPLYKQNKKCHDMDRLNCYLCACPNFRFDDEGLSEYNNHKVLSRCTINNGGTIAHSGKIHHDCSSCTVPHHKSFIKKNFDVDWEKMMSECNLGS